MSELRVCIDYESRSKVNLAKAGAITYAQHSSTSILCLSYKINDGPVKLWIPERTPIPDDLWQAFESGVLVAHNSSFEQAITKHCLPRYRSITARQKAVLTSLPPSRWRCTAAKAAACSLPRKLETAAQVLGLPIQKDKEGHRLMLKHSKPRRPTKNNPAIWFDDVGERKKIYSYCLTDTKVEYLLDEELPDLMKEEQAIWELDQKINQRGVPIDIPLVKKILGLIEEEEHTITEGVRKLSDGEINKVTQTAKVLAWLNHRGADMPNLQANTIKEKLMEELPDDVRQMLEYRQGGSKTSTKKYKAMLAGVGPDNIARELLLYNGATPTARWSGKRLQPQNFSRPTAYLISKGFKSDEAIELIQKGGLPAIKKRYGKTKAMEVLGCCARGMIVAPPGEELYCADFSAVEARLAFWVAEYEEGLEAFRKNKKLYEEMASEIFDLEIADIAKDSIERFIGKESILGAQYGCGWKAFRDNCKKKGRVIGDDTAKKAVYTYRKIHHFIPTLWKNLEEAAIEAIMKPGTRKKLHKVEMYVSGKWFNIKLPSGRRLRYFKPRIAQKQLARGRMVPEIRYWGMDHHQWRECAIWGGIFTNHIVQGIARDLMANAMKNIEEGGYKFLLSIHDEGLSSYKKGEGNLKEYLALMTQLPDWCDAPITCEGWVGPRYHK